jgi:hypothetical protein
MTPKGGRRDIVTKRRGRRIESGKAWIGRREDLRERASPRNPGGPAAGGGNPGGALRCHDDRRERRVDYDLSGNMTGYRQKSAGTDSPDLVSDVKWEGRYDTLNRLVGYTEETQNTDRSTDGNVLNVVLLSQRVSSDYDDQNHLVGYAQVNRDAQGNESEVLWSGVNGGRGLVVDFEEQTTDAQETERSKGRKESNTTRRGGRRYLFKKKSRHWMSKP